MRRFVNSHSDLCLSALVVMLLTVLAGQCFSVMRVKSATFDEPFYISAGYAYLTRGRFELNREHPPLMKYLIGFPLLFQDLRPLEDFADWPRAPERRMALGAAFLFENQTDADTVLFWSRVPVVMLSVATGLCVWIWARRLYGTLAGLVALLLYCLCPNVVAHSSLATLDLGVTAGVLAASILLWRWSLRPTVGRMVAAGTALAAALLMKFSAIVVLPLVPLAWWAVGRGIEGSVDRATKGKTIRGRPAKAARRSALSVSGWMRASVGVAGILLVCGILVAAAYGFSRFGIAEYVRGFKLGVLERQKLTQEGYQSFCWGRYSLAGFWYYHFAAFLIKTPIPVLMLGAATVFRWASPRVSLARARHVGSATSSSDSRSGGGRFDEWFLVLPIVLTFLITIPIQKNFGLRNALPVYPSLFVLAGGTAAWLWGARRGSPDIRRDRLGRLHSPPSSAHFDVSQHPDRRDKPGGPLLGRILVVLLVAWSAWGAVSIHPDQLSYFNELVGGPTRGIRYLDDSNIDWGQDLKRLAGYVRQRDIRGLKLYYFGSYFLKPAAKHYGLEYTPMDLPREVEQPPPGWYAVSAHHLQRPRLLRNSEVRFDWLDRFKPEAVIGHSIYVYHFP